MASKYRVFYGWYHGTDVCGYEEDIKACTKTEAVRKAKMFIERRNNERKERRRNTLILNGLREAEHFTDKQLLAGSYFELTGVSLVTEILTPVEVKK